MPLSSTDVSALLNGVQQRAINFADVIGFIDTHYHYKPVKFVNGLQHNDAGENTGSAKIFGFAKLHHLSPVDTLSLFAEHYQAVKNAPDGTDHANIRNFQRFGWGAFLMEHNPLSLKTSATPSKK